MAVDRLSSQVPGFVSTFNTTGNWSAPSNTNKVYVTLKGASGGNNVTSGNSGGGAVMGGAYVTVAGGATYPVVIGAGGVDGGTFCTAYSATRYSYTCSAYTITSANSGGTTSWDSNAIVVYGGTAAGTSSNGVTGSVSFDTTIPEIAPVGAVSRISTTTTGNTNAGAGQAFVFLV